jgi:hypothetical protein
MKRLIAIVLICVLVPFAHGETLHLSGGIYTGEVVDGYAHGQGTWTHPDGNKYVGEWKDGRADGQGTYTRADGGKYVGEY